MGFYRFGFSCLLNFILIIFSFFSASVYAANKTQLQKYNESPLSNVRNQVADQNAGSYTEIPNSNRKITNINTNVDTGKISGYIEDKTNYNGSLGKTYVATEIPYSPDSAAKTWAKRLGKWGKGGVGAIVGGIVLDKFIDGVGWVMDEGGKIKKPYSPDSQCAADGSNCQFSAYLWGSQQIGFYTTSRAACVALAKWNSANLGVVDTLGSVTSVSANTAKCFISRYSSVQNDVWTETPIVTASVNKNYSSSSEVPKDQDVSQQEIEDAIKDYLLRNPRTQLAADLLTNAYTLQDPNGNPTDDPKKADPDLNDAPREIHNATNDVLKSNDPLSTGKTSTFPIVTYNNVTNNYNETTTNTDTTNNTTTTTTTTGESSTDIPPFCEYAATACDWFGWTKEEPQQEQDTKPVLKDLDITEETQNRFNWSKQCPAPVSSSVDIIGFSWNYEFSYEPICTAFDKASWFFVFASLIGAVFIVAGVRNG